MRATLMYGAGPYKSMPHDDTGRRMGHEFIGVAEDVGADVATIKPGDLVLSPFLWSDGSCVFCREGLQSECLHGGRYGSDDVDGGQGEAVRVPQRTARSSCCRPERTTG